MQEGRYFNDSLEHTRAFQNPAIMEKLIDYLGLDQYGSNFDKEIYDPSSATNTLDAISESTRMSTVLIHW